MARPGSEPVAAELAVATAGIAAEAPDSPLGYWEQRARRFAIEGEGLGAVCSYGMPAFYNRATQACQRLALAPWLRLRPGASGVGVRCGVGRRCRELAARGAL